MMYGIIYHQSNFSFSYILHRSVSVLLYIIQTYTLCLGQKRENLWYSGQNSQMCSSSWDTIMSVNPFLQSC